MWVQFKMWTEGLLDLLEEGKGRNTQMLCCSFPLVKALQKDWDKFYSKERCPSFSFQKQMEILLETTEYARKVSSRQAARGEWRWQLEHWKVCKELSYSYGLTLPGSANLRQPQTWEQIMDLPDSGLAFYSSPPFRIELCSLWGQPSTGPRAQRGCGISDLRGFQVPTGQSPEQTCLDAALALLWAGARPLPPASRFLKDHSTQVSNREIQ